MKIIENIIKEFKESVIKYDADDIIKDPKIIFSELNNKSLFENKKTLIIKLSDCLGINIRKFHLQSLYAYLK